MKLNRKRVLTGLAATGITVGTLASGGVAVASTGPAQAPATTAAAHATCAQMHGHGKWGAHDTVLKAVAGYLGVSQDQLRGKLESGKSLADVAKEQGKSVSGLKATILTSVTTRVNSANWLNASQKAALLTDVKSHLGDIVNATCTKGAPSGSPSSWSSGSPSGSS
ncbi:MAG TPA: hypothetical protein VHZ03_34760 [Trebonia sp.]|jgi:hypothetical protein|nr:hypothetical protein [Trebonia sp.]